MKDTYTRGLLLVIALLLAVIAFRNDFQPDAVYAQTKTATKTATNRALSAAEIQAIYNATR